MAYGDKIIIGIGLSFIAGIIFTAVLSHSTGIYDDIRLSITLIDCEYLKELGIKFQSDFVKDIIIEKCFK